MTNFDLWTREQLIDAAKNRAGMPEGLERLPDERLLEVISSHLFRRKETTSVLAQATQYFWGVLEEKGHISLLQGKVLDALGREVLDGMVAEDWDDEFNFSRRISLDYAAEVVGLKDTPQNRALLRRHMVALPQYMARRFR
jgi:hypothetical protein